MQKIKYLSISLLKPHPGNPRIIKDKQFKTLCQSLKDNPDYFETRPILCNPDMVVFAGNMRLKAAIEIGLTQVPVSIMDIPVERQEEIMIRDNVQNGEWDFDQLANEWSDIKLIDWGMNLPMPESVEGTELVSEKKKITCPNCGHEW